MPYKKEESILTVEEIAKELGISKTTVSRALSGKGRISLETRARVFDFVSRSDLACNVAARHTGREKAYNLIFVIPSTFIRLDLPFLRNCLYGIYRYASQQGYDLLICLADQHDTGRLEQQLSAGKADGVIFTEALSKDPRLELAHRYETPYVLIGRSEEPSGPQVDNDQVGGSCEITSILLQTGLRRIAYVGGDLRHIVNEDRLHGYLRALENSGIPAEKELIKSGVETPEQRLNALEAVLAQKPECLLCGDDNLSFFMLKELQRRGISVPGDIRLASLYDSELLSNASPPVSAVQYDAIALGTAACRSLLDKIAGKKVPSRQTLGFQVVLRASTKKGV